MVEDSRYDQQMMGNYEFVMRVLESNITQLENSSQKETDWKVSKENLIQMRDLMVWLKKRGD